MIFQLLAAVATDPVYHDMAIGVANLLAYVGTVYHDMVSGR